jgi:protein phosphatase 1 regulatory subunit 7
MKIQPSVKFEVDQSSKWRILWLDSDRIEESMAYCKSHGLDGLGISPYKGFRLHDLSFLQNYETIKAIKIDSAKRIDISALQYLRRLQYVLLNENTQPFDFSIFPELEEIIVEWHPKMVITGCSNNLHRLYLRKYHPRSHDLTELSDLVHLTRLEIVQSPIISLKGVGELDKLERLEFYYLTKLERIDEIEKLSKSLKYLYFDVCRKIKNHDHAQVMRSLEVLAFNNCGTIPSIKFIEKMPKLKDFRFVDTNVLDGDMTPCLPLEYAGFLKKRHFSHSPEEVNQRIQSSLT